MANGLEQYEWDFIDPPMNDLYCPMCKEILKEPMLTECCGSHFCRTCIHPILKAKQPCPNHECNKADYNCIIDRPKWRRVLELDVLCPLKGRGCNWKGEVGTREKHLDPDEGDCDYIDMDCSYGCGENMERYELAEHLDRFCPKRPYTCQHCGLAEVYDSIVNEHTPVCLKYPVPCANKCGREDIPRASYDQHLLTCPEQEIECEFRYAGCDVRLPRKNLPKHAQDDVHVHLSLQISFASSELSKRDQQLEKLSSTWENKHKELNKEIERLSRQSEQDTNEREEDFSRMKRELKLKEDKISELEAMMKEKREMFEQQGLAMDRMEASLTRMGESQKGSEKNLQKKVESLSVACKERHQEAANQIGQVRDLQASLLQNSQDIDKTREQIDLLEKRMSNVSHSEAASHMTIPTLDSTAELAAASLPSEPISHSAHAYENFNSDALALLEKLPEGSIDGVHYDWRTGRVFIDKDPPSEEDERISKFQAAYQGIVGIRKLKIEGVPVPTAVSSDALSSLIRHYNATYNQCVFICQEEYGRVVKIVSTSSRQIDQAKKLLADELAKSTVVAATSSKSTSTTEMILLSDDRKLTLKKADIVKEDDDMIVNPANKRLLHGGGVAGALNRASNGQLQKHSSRYVQKKGAEGHLSANSGHHNQGYPNSGGTSHGVNKQESNKKEDKCPICLSDFTDPVRTKCGHVFCRHCISEALQHSSFCPTCKAALRAIVGNQPVGGKMNVQYSRSSLLGNQRYGTIEIHYYIPGGVQTKEHPNPGQKYFGTSRRAYLPNSPEGQEVLRLLQKAFDARLVFTVGTSVTSRQSNVVTWNDIHHKTNMSGGQQACGYPDPTYLQRVKADLAAIGIRA